MTGYVIAATLLIVGIALGTWPEWYGSIERAVIRRSVKRDLRRERAGR